MAMPDYEIRPDVMLRPSLTAAFTAPDSIKFRVFRFDVIHFDCEEPHPALLYALMRPRKEIDRWLMAAETISEDDKSWTEGIKRVAFRKPPSTDFVKYATVFGRPWTMIVKNPVPLIMHQEKALDTMPAAWKMLFRDRTLAEIDRAVIDCDLDEDAEWDDSIEWPVLEALKERYGGDYGVDDDD